MGLRILIFVFPAIALSVIIIAMYKYPLHGEHLANIKEKLKEIHEKKKAQFE